MSEQRIPPSVEVREFASPKELFTYLDEEIARLRANLGEYLRRLETVKTKAEMLGKLESIVKQLQGGAGGIGGTVINLDNVEVAINPTPKQEFDFLVEAIKHLQDRIVYLEKVRKGLEPLSGLGDVNITIEAVMINGVPKSLLVKM